MSDISVTLTGVDGSVWRLLDPTSGVQLSGGISGLHLPTATHQWSDSAVGDGRRHRGVSYAGRSGTLQVHVGDLKQPVRVGSDWRALDAAWWAALSPEAPCTLTVATSRRDAIGRPDARSLKLFDASTDPGYATDPAQIGSAYYDVDVEAESAWWAGPDVTRRFEYRSGLEQNYYGGAGGTGFGPPFIIGAGSQFSSAAIANPGQRPAYARWKIIAPFGAATVGLPGGQTISLPFAQVASQQVLIDTDPRRRTIRDGAGNNLWPLVGTGLDPIFAPIPPGASVPLFISLERADVGAAVEVTVTPEYRRGW